MSISEWTLSDLPLSEGICGIAGYAVLDALGLKMGRVSGWVKDPYQQVRMIKLVVREWFEAQEFLVPIGSITLIDDHHSQMHLRELTRRSLPKYCIEYTGELPEPQLLKSLIRFFPNPRPVIVERLQRPDERALSYVTGGTPHGQVIGASESRISHADRGGSSWNGVEHLSRLTWTPLSYILFDRTQAQ